MTQRALALDFPVEPILVTAARSLAADLERAVPITRARLTDTFIQLTGGSDADHRWSLPPREAAYDAQAAIIEDQGSDEAAVEAAEAEIARIDAETRALNERPAVIDADTKRDTGMFLTLGNDGVPVLQPHYFTSLDVLLEADEGAIEVVPGGPAGRGGRAAMSQRLIDELAMQRRDVLTLHVANDPALALDLFVFALADVGGVRFGPAPGLTLSGSQATGPAYGFEAKDAPATAALAELRSSLDESWRDGESLADRFDRFRMLSEDARAAWLGWVVARTLEASLNVSGQRANPFHDHLGRLIGIDMAAWWRPTAANFFDRVSKAVALDAVKEVGGANFASRFASAKKGEVAASAERIFAGTFITEVEVRDRALAWLPAAMTFAGPPGEAAEARSDADPAEPDALAGSDPAGRADPDDVDLAA